MTLTVRPVAAGVAAGHPATAAAGREILAEGGNAADAAVAATLASCVAETIMTGLGGGGHAIHWSAATGEAWLIDFFVNVPGIGGDRGRGERFTIDVAFGAQIIPYEIGMGTAAVPGVAAGCGEIHSRWGRLDWARLVEPARRLAAEGVPMPAKHTLTLRMLTEGLVRDAGTRIYAPGGRLLQEHDLLCQPGLVTVFDALEQEGPRTFTKGTVAECLVTLCRKHGGLITREDLASYEVRVERAPRGVPLGSYRVTSRHDLNGFLTAIAALPADLATDPLRWAPAFAAACSGGSRGGDTTNLVTADADGNACVVTTSLGLGTGRYVPGLDLHLNSMLGETDLLIGPLTPGARVGSMMAPSLALDDRGRLRAAAGAAGGSRIRSALASVLAANLLQGQSAQASVSNPRLHVIGRKAHVEPAYPEAGIDGLERAGYDVVRWHELHHFFGGASLIATDGGGADPRRGGSVALLEPEA